MDIMYNEAMERTTLVLPRELREKVRRLAAERGVSMGEIMREAIEEKVRARRPKPRLGIFDSGHTDTGSLAGEIKYEPPSWR